MRIVHLVHLLAPESRGGTQAYVAALARRQADDGHAVLIVAGSDRFEPGARFAREELDGVPVRRLLRDPGQARSGDLGDPALRARLVDEIAAFDADVVHVHHWSGLEREVVGALRDAGRATVVTLHDLFTTCPRFFRMPDHETFCARDVGFDDCARCLAPDLPGFDEAALTAGLARRFAAFQNELAAADVVLTVSAAQRDLLTGLPGFGVRDLEVEPIAAPWPDERPAAARARTAGRLDLVQWGGLDPRKGPHVLLEALRRTEDPDAYTLTLRGRAAETGYDARLKALAEGLDVRFPGPYADRELAGFGGLHDLAVFPFLAFETHALVVDEAMWAGLPVVVSDLGAPPERLGGRGRTFPPGDAAALARLLDHLRRDPDELTRMRRAPHGARSLAEHVRRIEARYAAVLSR